MPSRLEETLGHRFRDPTLLAEALTHRSYANERGLPGHYERLEFLGDSVLGLVAARWLFARFPRYSEGRLSRLKSQVVSTTNLARCARRLDLGAVLKLGVGEERSGGRDKPSLLADAAEAVFGALYLDAGLEVARQVIEPLLAAALEEDPDALIADAKTDLQEWVQARGWQLPEYRLVGERGPDHDKEFEVECWLEGRRVGRGEGKSKKVAEQRAAAAALDSLTGAEASP